MATVTTTTDRPMSPAHAASGDKTPDKIGPVAKRYLDAGGRPIWTHQDFDWAFRNPFATVFKRGNDYVTEQWSEDYFIACKKDVGLFKEAVFNIGRSFADITKKDVSAPHAIGCAFLHLLNALAIAAKLAINIEIANFLKGTFGAVLSSVKAVVHIVLAIVYLILAVGALFAGRFDLVKDFVDEFKANLGFFVKDLASVISCLGHAIPSWLPLVIMILCPPAGLALILLKLASQFTGIFDVAAYSGTAALLYQKVIAARSKPDDEESRRSEEAWKRLKRELHPCKSVEGALLTGYALHVLLEGVATVVDAVAPGAGTLTKYAVYGTVGVAEIGLLAAVRKNQTAAKAAKEAPPAPYVPANQQPLVVPA